MVRNPSPGRHVLIVEDEPDFAALLQSILVRAGYTVATAHDVDAALSQAHDVTPDLITLDIQMPKKSGALFYRQLRSSESLRDVPVVVVTGLTHDDPTMGSVLRVFLEPGDESGPAAYVEKPVDATAFLDTVESVLSGTHDTMLEWDAPLQEEGRDNHTTRRAGL